MANSEIQQKLFAIAHADWNTQYITADAEVKNKCCFGRIIKLLGIQNWPFIKNLFSDSTTTIISAQVDALRLIAASVTEIDGTEADRSDLHAAVATKINALIDHFNSKTKREKIGENIKFNLASYHIEPPVVNGKDKSESPKDAGAGSAADTGTTGSLKGHADSLEAGEVLGSDNPPNALSPPVSESRDDSSVGSIDQADGQRRSSRRKANAERSVLRKAKKAEQASVRKSEKKETPKTDVDSAEKSETKTRSKSSKKNND